MNIVSIGKLGAYARTLITAGAALLITASTPIWATAAIGVGTFVAVTVVGVAIDWGQLK